MKKKMIKCQMIVAAAMLLLTNASFAQEGWYTGLSVGANNQYDNKVGYAVLGQLGYGLGNGLRPEFEVSYRNNKDNYDNGTVNLTGGMMNLWYDFQLKSAKTVHPYVGAGAGVVVPRVSEPGETITGLGPTWGLQLGGGVAVDLTENLELSLDLRHLRTGDQTLTSRYKSGSTTVTLTYPAAFSSTSAGLALRYRFGK
jgi:opacity protein-like surface antigen